MKNKNSVVVIIGPTASGKTEVSIDLARQFNGEIISADSRQFYKRMDIGTAKPTSWDLTQIKHYLVDVSQPDEVWSLAKFCSVARECIDEIHSKGKLPFVVGGTGQYIWGLLEGWSVPSEAINMELRSLLENWSRELGSDGIHAVLSRIDPAAGSFIQPTNVRRTIRALEVIFSTGRLFSEQRTKNPPDDLEFIILGIEWERQELYKRVDLRIEAMLNSGLLEEVRHLLNSGFDPNSSALSAIGYREITGYLMGKHSLDDAVMLIKRNTRQYIRRQANWFKKDDPRIHWFNAGDDMAEKMAEYVRKALHFPS